MSNSLVNPARGDAFYLKTMRNLILLICILLTYPAYSQDSKTNQEKAVSVLIKVSEELNSFSAFTYDLKRELNYASENYQNFSEWSGYYNFDPTIASIGFSYQISDLTSNNFFNGTEMFELAKANQTIKINTAPEKNDFKSLSFFYNSLITLRNILPKIIQEQTSIQAIADTIINNNPYQIVTINLGKRRIQNLGEGFDEMQTPSNFIYKIIIDEMNHLPVEILQGNDLNNDFIKTNFSNIHISPSQPSEKSWYYSTYLDEYKQEKRQELPQLISVGSATFDWTLPLYNQNENVSISQLNGKVILLDFWFKNCGACIASVPHLNALTEKYEGKNFEILGINTWDSKADIDWFANKHQIAFPVLMNGKDLAEKYGIYAFPTLILIDQEGKILYSGGFNQSKIEDLIEKAL